jgi:hypothetical protein
VNIILIVLVCISIPIGLCEDGDMLIDLKTFLNEDMTNIEAQNEGLISSQSSRLLAQRANESDVDIGVMKFYNPDEKVAYYFCYMIDEQSKFIFIDSVNDKLYTYNDAKNRLSGVEMSYTSYKYYFPYLSYRGCGAVPPYIIKYYLISE